MKLSIAKARKNTSRQAKAKIRSTILKKFTKELSGLDSGVTCRPHKGTAAKKELEKDINALIVKHAGGKSRAKSLQEQAMERLRASAPAGPRRSGRPRRARR